MNVDEFKQTFKGRKVMLKNFTGSVMSKGAAHKLQYAGKPMTNKQRSKLHRLREDKGLAFMNSCLADALGFSSVEQGLRLRDLTREQADKVMVAVALYS